MSELTAAEARAIAEEAFIYAYPMVHGYRAIHWLGVRKGGFNRLDHYRKIIDPSDDLNLEVQINVDTLYTLVPVDLRDEPMVLTVPEIDRYFSIQFADFYTHNYAWLGTRTTGQHGGNYLLAQPGWSGETPPGITAVIPTETWITYFVVRILCRDKNDEANVNALQDQFAIQPLSRFLGKSEKPVTDAGWPWPSKQMLTGLPTFSYFNFLLKLAPPRDDERDLMAQFERIGIAPGKEFDIEQFAPEIRTAIEQGAVGALERIRERCRNIGRRENGWFLVPRIRGDRNLLSGSSEKRFTRAVQAMFGIYGTDIEECVYFPARYDADDQLLDAGAYNYRLHFPEPPPVDGFWSITVYESDTEFLVKNEIGRYALGDRSDLLRDADGGFTLYLQHQPPATALSRNWLPVPAKELLVVLRLYIPRQPVINGTYVPPGIERAEAVAS